MRDLVETVIGQVLKQQPKMKTPVQQAENNSFAQPTRLEKGVEVRDEKLWGVCCQFEAIFLQQMLAAMRKTVPESKLLPKGYADGVYEGMMDQAIAKSGSQQAPLGLALNMYKQLQAAGEESLSAQEVQRTADKLQSDTPVSLSSSLVGQIPQIGQIRGGRHGED